MERNYDLQQQGITIQKLLNAIQPAVQTAQPVGGMRPNILYDLGTLEGDTAFLLAAPEDNSITNHYYWAFDVEEIEVEEGGVTVTALPTITWPAGIVAWNGGAAPEISAHTHYEISVLNGIGAFMDVELPEEEEGE